jgi:hypothetical protein
VVNLEITLELLTAFFFAIADSAILNRGENGGGNATVVHKLCLLVTIQSLGQEYTSLDSSRC